MAGFLDPEQRVIDLILTDTAKSLLMKGQLNFSYWVPFDDEVNYQPAITIWNSSSLSQQDLANEIVQKTQNVIEDPVIVEAVNGYTGVNNTQEDLVNVKNPMFTAKTGIGHSLPLPQLIISQTGTITIPVTQTPNVNNFVQTDLSGNVLAQAVTTDGYTRTSKQERINVTYSTGSFTADNNFEGMLITIYQNVSGTLQEVVHNRDSDGNITYRNDLSIQAVLTNIGK